MTTANSLLFLVSVALISASAACSADHSALGTAIYWSLLLAGLSLGTWALWRDKRHAG